MLFGLNYTSVIGQGIAEPGSKEQVEYEIEYNKNIRMTKINGVYIPSSIKEAHERLKDLSPSTSLESFRNAPEQEVAKKLHFGLGRWMIQNWNFYSGSRLSHLLKQKGLLHPDDMAQYMLRTFHRYLNEILLDDVDIIVQLAAERRKIADEARGF